jgi:hypothetical protein
LIVGRLILGPQHVFRRIDLLGDGISRRQDSGQVLIERTHGLPCPVWRHLEALPDATPGPEDLAHERHQQLVTLGHVQGSSLS